MSTQTLIEGVEPPPAPKRTKEMIQAAVKAYIERQSFDWGDPEDAARDIASQWHYGIDGYDLATSLDLHCCWTICAEDVENLDHINSVVRDAEEEARKAWVTEWDIKPPLKLGTEIKQGVIEGIDKYQAATYLVKENGCTQTGRHLLIKFEDAQPVYY